MSVRFKHCACFLICLALSAGVGAQTAAQSSSSSSSSTAKRVNNSGVPPPGFGIDAGVVANGVYRNKTLALSCIIPPGWVLRTDEMNARDEKRKEEEKDKADAAKGSPAPASSEGAKVLLAAFSRPT